MTQDTKLQQLVINKLTTAQYNSAVEAGTIDPNQLYMTTDSVTISDIKVNGVSVVDGEEADITLGTMATETASDYSKKTVADTLYAAKSLESTVSTHIANKTNPHQVTKAQVGLGNVDNTSDLNKPISTLTQAALNNKVDKVSTANKIYGTDSSGVQTTYDKSSFGNVDDVKVGTTSVVTNKVAVLGTMAGENTGNYYKKTDLASVATSGSWADLTNTPTTIGGYGITDAYTKSEIDGKLSAGMHYKGTVASYSNLPTTGQVIGDLYNVTDTGANYAWNGTAWDKMSENVDLSNFYTKSEIDGFLEDKADSEDIPTATSQLTNDSGYITSITSSDVTTALGYTPYNSTNPSGYITSSAIEGFIRNTATGTNSLTILGNATSQNQAVNIGASSSVTGTQGVAIGYNASTITSVAIGASASANYTHALAIGNGATVSAAGGIQIGQGTTSDASLNVALGGTTHTNYKLLGSDGKIPDDRLNTTIARTSQIPTTVAELTDASNYALVSSLATVATSGDYDDLTNKPTIPTVDQTYSASSTNAQSGVAVASAISGKRDIISNASRVYTTDGSGNQSEHYYSNAPYNNAIAVFDGSSHLKSSSPSANNDVATKKYVDDGLSEKLNGYNIRVAGAWTGGVHLAKFVTVDYSTADSENGVFIRISMVNSHGNGITGRFYQDIVLNVNYTGTVAGTIYRYFAEPIEFADSEYYGKHWGDVCWTIDTTNKIVKFFVLMRQYSYTYETPYFRLNASTKGVITQHTSVNSEEYSSGTQYWTTIYDYNELPSQTGNNGKFLTTNGSSVSWATVTIPTVNNATLTIQKNSANVATFTANASSNVTANITVPTSMSDLSDANDYYTATQVDNAIASAVSSVYKPAGNVAYASLPTPASSNLGNVYNVTDSFTTDSRFVEGSGKTYPAGTNVVIIESNVEGTIFYAGWGGSSLTECHMPPTNQSHSIGDGEGAGYGTLYELISATSSALTFRYANYKTGQVPDGDNYVAADDGVGYYEITNSTGIFNRYSSLDKTINGEQYYCWWNGDNDYPYVYTKTLNVVAEQSGYFFDVLAGMVDLSGYVPTSRTINSKALTGNITLSASDVSAVAANTAITGATKCKITYDSKGLVTAGANLSASDIPDLSATYQTKLTSGTNIKTINSTSLLGSGDISITGLPSQTSQSGKFLTTNGTTASWATVTQPSIATTSTTGLVKPDGTTITITNDGTISAASGSAYAMVIVDYTAEEE